jgi:hypothetical protein
MYAFRFVVALALTLGTFSAPVMAQSPPPNALGYAWWSAATADQKQLVIRGEIDGVPTGYLEPVIILTIAQALTGNATVKTLVDNLDKTVPAFSKTPAQYADAVDSAYAKPAARKLTVSQVMLCLADKPFGADTVDGCLKSLEN